MSTTGNLNQQKLTGDTNIGNLYRFMLLHKDLTIYEQTVFMSIGRYSLGYCRISTNVPSDRGYNRNSKAWADALNISKTSFLKAVKSLVEKGLITIHTGSNYRKDGGSYPDYYSIKFNKELQVKHHIYFNTNGIKDLIDNNTNPVEPEFVCPPIESYFVHGKSILDIANPNHQQKYELLSKSGKLVHPTIEQLTNHLKD